jgi:DNA-binding winged helix-turn-helix (wHTH) protein
VSAPARHSARYRFGGFALDTASRSLTRDGEPVALNARYFDALVLLVREHGRLVGKQRFFDEVWAGSVVTDAALTQCIKEIRRLLGDDAGDPRFIRTVPAHGYCFIAAVAGDEDAPSPIPGGDARADDGHVVAVSTAAPLAAIDPSARTSAIRDSHPSASRPGPSLPNPVERSVPRWLADTAAATAGGALAGIVGGLLYGSAIAFAPPGQALGSLSVLLVLLVLSVLVGMTGALGVGFGIAMAQRIAGTPTAMLAAAGLGGLAVGGITRLLGSDAFTLLVGRAPIGITGGLEGAAIGLAVAGGLLLGGGLDAPRARRAIACATATTAAAGALIPLAGGSMMATSLARVAAAFDDSRLDMAPLGGLFGEPPFGPGVQTALGALEGAVFGACVVAALLLGRRWLRQA